MIWKDGTFYEGSWIDGQPHGYGRLIHDNGDVYEGELSGGVADGYGVYIKFTDKVRYEG